MSYRKGLQSLMMAVVLVGIGVLSAETQESASNPAQQWEALQKQVVARYKAGDYAGAEQLARQALAVAERAFGPEHPDTATSLNNLAVVLPAQSHQYGEVEPLLRRALTIREKVLGAEHPDTATSLNNLAGMLRDQDRYGEAEPFLRRALAIDEKVLGAEHPDTVDSLSNLVARQRCSDG